MSSIIKEVFGTVDYLVFAGMLVVSAAIGMWYAYADRKKNNTQEFLMGGRSLSVFPVAMSILSSFISAISLLGAPSEVYRYGTQYAIKLLGMCLMIPTTAYLYLPVYYNLGLTSAYEYLERRFHRVVRLMGSAVFVMHMVIYTSVVLYAPALALSEVTGLGLMSSVLSIGFVCTFYTSIGGIKAVVWTDLFQTILMYASLGVVIIKGVHDLGGFNVIWKRSLEGGRIEFFRFDSDPTIRHTFWGLIFGGYITWMATYAANQAMIQRYLTIGTLKGAQRCLWINLPALFLLISLTTFAGLVVYAYYWKCDPIGAKIVNKPDQKVIAKLTARTHKRIRLSILTITAGSTFAIVVFPRFVMETLGSFPGIPGLFVSGVFSGSLSTVSSGVNSLAAVVLEDFIKGTISIKLTEVWATRISKLLAVSFGLMSIALVFVAQNLGGILQVAGTIHGIVGGPMLGVFTLGLFFPCANSLGASLGLICGLAVSVWFGIGAFVAKPLHPKAPMSYHNCTELFYNVTKIDITDIHTVLPEVNTRNDHIFYPYKLSYTWLSFIGFIIVLTVGNFISLLSGPARDVDQILLSPLTKFYGRCSPKTICQRFWSTKLKKEQEQTSPSVLSLTKIEGHI